MLTGIEEQIVLLRLFSGRLKENSYFSRRGQTFVFFTDRILLHFSSVQYSLQLVVKVNCILPACHRWVMISDQPSNYYCSNKHIFEMICILGRVLVLSDLSVILIRSSCISMNVTCLFLILPSFSKLIPSSEHWLVVQMRGKDYVVV